MNTKSGTRVFTAALFYLPQTGNNLNIHPQQDGYFHLYNHTGEFMQQRNECRVTSTHINFTDIILSKRSQTQRTHRALLHQWNKAVARDQVSGGRSEHLGRDAGRDFSHFLMWVVVTKLCTFHENSLSFVHVFICKLKFSKISSS